MDTFNYLVTIFNTINIRKYGKLEWKAAIVTVELQTLVEKGAAVVISDLYEQSGELVGKELRENGRCSEEKSVKNLVAETVNRYRKVDM
ncbi:hypothetical protein ACQKL0_17060 [Peribacillus sp. NPDC097264]|uniref:hypothetical protein n=1 Tax=Peribacillus sp. NPDC097264 TaxID=3390616 RepID=UPI003D04995C